MGPSTTLALCPADHEVLIIWPDHDVRRLLPGDLHDNFHLVTMSCSPQFTQYLVPPSRLLACFSLLHSPMRMASLTTTPQSGQKRTGAFARL